MRDWGTHKYCTSRGFNKFGYGVYLFFSIFPDFSSPEPKAQGELIINGSSRRLCVCVSVCMSVDIFKLEYLSNQWTNRNDILTEPLLG